MAVSSINPSITNFGTIRSQNASYATARTGGTLSIQDASGLDNRTGQLNVSALFQCFEAFYEFDVASAVPVGSTISGAVLSLTPSGDFTTGSDFIMKYRVYDFGASVGTGDWVSGESLDGTTLGEYNTASGWTGSEKSFSDIAAAAAVQTALDGSGLLRVVIYSSRHAAGDEPAAPSNEYAFFSGPNNATESARPKLTVSYVAPVTSFDSIGMLGIFG